VTLHERPSAVVKPSAAIAPAVELFAALGRDQSQAVADLGNLTAGVVVTIEGIRNLVPYDGATRDIKPRPDALTVVDTDKGKAGKFLGGSGQFVGVVEAGDLVATNPVAIAAHSLIPLIGKFDDFVSVVKQEAVHRVSPVQIINKGIMA